jgi:hypothetical protein
MGRAKGGPAATAARAQRAASRRGGERTAWTAERIADELVAFAESLGHQPTLNDFYNAGRGDLLGAMKTHGTRAQWMALVADLPPAPRRSGQYGHRMRLPDERRLRWTDEALEAELRAFVSGRVGFPTMQEFVAAGRTDLRDAVKNYGGTVLWAQRLGLALRHGQDRSPYGAAEAIADAQRIIAKRGRLPNVKALRSSGHPRLATFIDHQCGSVRRFVSDYLPTV